MGQLLAGTWRTTQCKERKLRRRTWKGQSRRAARFIRGVSISGSWIKLNAEYKKKWLDQFDVAVFICSWSAAFFTSWPPKPNRSSGLLRCTDINLEVLFVYNVSIHYCRLLIHRDWSRTQIAVAYADFYSDKNEKFDYVFECCGRPHLNDNNNNNGVGKELMWNSLEKIRQNSIGCFGSSWRHYFIYHHYYSYRSDMVYSQFCRIANREAVVELDIYITYTERGDFSNNFFACKLFYRGLSTPPGSVAAWPVMAQ